MVNSTRLAELCERIVDCPHSTPTWTEAGVVVLRNQNIRNGRLDLSEPSFTDEKHWSQRTKRAEPRPGDLVITREAPMGEVCMIPEGLRCCLGQRMVLLRPNPERVDSRFLLYALQAPQVQHEIRTSEGTGSTVSNLRIPLLERLPIPAPPLAEQRRIGRILGAFDDKIELTRRMNETLQRMARDLFKAWFVDFDPVRAKLEGRGTSWAGHVSELFPAGLCASPRGDIPKGWRWSTLGQQVLNFDSQRVPLSASERAKRKGIFPYHGAAGIMDHIDGYLFDGVFVLVGEDGSVIRDEAYAVTQYVTGRFWVNNHAHVLQGREYVSTEQLLLYFDFYPVAPFVTGAVQPKLSQGRMNEMPWLDGGPHVCNAFADLVKPWYQRVSINRRFSLTLAEIRDALLPRLVGGELTVCDAESVARMAGV
jgi:type I restriction enzyme, S subunit